MSQPHSGRSAPATTLEADVREMIATAMRKRSGGRVSVDEAMEALARVAAHLIAYEPRHSHAALMERHRAALCNRVAAAALMDDMRRRDAKPVGSRAQRAAKAVGREDSHA